jgi:uncharacterized lipoprotein YddW (UPF0748 family)
MSFFASTGVRLAARAHRTALLAAAVAAILVAQHGLRAADRVTDIRAIWVSSDRIASADASRRLVSTALSGSFNTLFVPIALDQPPGAGPDPIDAVIRSARERGLRVHAWVQTNRVSSADELPLSRDHVIYRHPEWLMVPRELALEMLGLDPRGPDYVGRLARWTRASGDRVHGLYLSPLEPASAASIADAIKRIVARYPVDGVHLDSLEFPGPEFDYSRTAMAQFRSSLRGQLPIAERERLDGIEAIDPFGYPEEFPAEWQRFRVTRLTSLVARIRAAVGAARSDAIVSAGVTPGADRALADHLQDWRTWFDNRFVDALARPAGSSAALLFSYDALIDPAAVAASAATASAADSQ